MPPDSAGVHDRAELENIRDGLNSKSIEFEFNLNVKDEYEFDLGQAMSLRSSELSVMECANLRTSNIYHVLVKRILKSTIVVSLARTQQAKL